MKRLLIIAGLVLLTVALVFLNQGVKRSATPDQDEDEQAQRSKAQPTQKPPSTPADLKAVLPPDETVGDPATAKHHITVGWVYDEENQQKPETLIVPLQAIHDYVEHSGGAVSAEIVNLDVPAEDRSPAARAVTDMGVHVDGHYLYGGNLSGTPFPPEQIMQALDGAVKKR